MTETTIETQSLRQRIDEARERLTRDRAEKEAEDRRREGDRLRTQMRKVLQIEVEPDAVIFDGHRPRVVVEGLRFSVDNDFGLVLLRECGACHKDVTFGVWSIEGLADAETRPFFYPHGQGNCVLVMGTEPPQSAEQRLVAALRDMIAQHSYQP